MVFLSEVIIHIGAISRNGLLDSFMREWSQLLDSDDSNILNKSHSYISLVFFTLVFQLVEELATTEENFLDLGRYSFSVRIDRDKVRSLSHFRDGCIGLDKNIITPLNLRSFFELKAIRGFLKFLCICLLRAWK